MNLKTKTYQTETDTYLPDDPTRFVIWVKCGNCRHVKPLRVLKGTLVNQGTLKAIRCVECERSGYLQQAEWNGVQYVTI